MRGQRDPGGSPRTLVIGVNWLGDAVMTLPALIALREIAPEEEIHVGIPSPLAPLIRMAAPVDEAWGWPGNASIRHRLRLTRGGRYRRVILLPNAFRAAWIAWLARIPERWGYAGQWRKWLLNRSVPGSRRPVGRHQSESYMEIIRALGWRGSPIPQPRFRLPSPAQDWARDLLREQLGPGPVIGMCPGAAYGPAKRWPAERFVAVARTLRRRARAGILLVGSQAEHAALALMAEAVGSGSLDTSGTTDLEKLAALLAHCDVVVANDSGPMHLAAAMGIPVVAIFGSTDPAATAPLGPHRVLSARAPCSPCLRRECPEGTYRCMAEIQPEQVCLAVEDFLGAARPGPEPFP